MFSLNLPPYATKIVLRDGKNMIWDVIRRKYVALTPEEWVRQHFVHFLIEHKGYPASLLANEVPLTLNGTSRRCDTVLYDRTLSPRMIIEYKAPHVSITQKVFDQICRYNLVFHVDYLIVSNGLSHYCCCMDYANDSYHFLSEVPEYSIFADKV
ncbi:MAG: type I restriction enzyme HsdR N-terminal domain-containing protein [Bacteroidaceae bacterium]|nr:type I restriction enzyme HsdR N-terminal domain-containing protein [Bacteroidaceae bacterium]